MLDADDRGIGAYDTQMYEFSSFEIFDFDILGLVHVRQDLILIELF